jgi:hypothetical protein
MPWQITFVFLSTQTLAVEELRTGTAALMAPRERLLATFMVLVAAVRFWRKANTLPV